MVRSGMEGEMIKESNCSNNTTPRNGTMGRLIKYLPPIAISSEDGGSDGVELVLLDRLMRLWKFRYCYWSSSQSYVLTSGWNRFVKENGLKAKETIKFFLCERGGAQQKHKFCMIDVDREDQINNVEQQPGVMDLQLVQRPTLAHATKEEEMEAMNLELQLALRPSGDNEAQAEGFTLFGVHMMKKECLNSLHS